MLIVFASADSFLCLATWINEEYLLNKKRCQSSADFAGAAGNFYITHSVPWYNHITPNAVSDDWLSYCR